jgi:hypothetical protein
MLVAIRQNARKSGQVHLLIGLLCNTLFFSSGILILPRFEELGLTPI